MKTLATLTGEKGFTAAIVAHDNGTVVFTADADIDADGSPHAYNPANTGTDYLANARDLNGQFCGVLTSAGHPVLQADGDLAPGFYVSTTRYEWADQPRGTQRRYVDGEKVPFMVVPPVIIDKVPGIVMGSRCVMRNIRNGRTVVGMVADSGPRTKCGEISPAAARALGLDSSPKDGGTDDPIVEYTIYVGIPAIVDGHSVPLQRANGEHVVVA